MDAWLGRSSELTWILLTDAMLQELDQAAKDLNISRQAVIKTPVPQALDQHYLQTSCSG